MTQEIPIPTEPTFTTGMTVSEAKIRAAKWWGEWRGAIRKDFNTYQEANVVKTSKGKPNGLPVPGVVIVGEKNENYVPNGIMSGLPWDELNEMEQLKVTYQWHYDHVLVPQFSEPMQSDKIN